MIERERERKRKRERELIAAIPSISRVTVRTWVTGELIAAPLFGAQNYR